MDLLNPNNHTYLISIAKEFKLFFAISNCNTESILTQLANSQAHLLLLNNC